ncbi:MAG: dihydrodipicolinate synthase family protein [Rhodobacteraceae bacterium]|nr:dihydrodipicolinate synthase family protein [Paracoccaceae bacterium]MCY4141555.1 dihydrodipicolinate synthase family protein [Paracoccaceae bacterium]
MTQRPAPKGVYSAVATPVTPDFKPDLPRLVAHCRWLLANGCDGLAPLGTTGEANSLSLSDRTSLIAGLAEAGLPMERVIFGTGSTSLGDTVTVSRAALDAGANGLLMLPPFYYRHAGEDGLFAYYSHVAERLLPRKPRIFLYHIPQMSMVSITVTLAARLREAFPGVFVGIKDSGGDFSHTRSFIREFDDFEAFSGSEPLAVSNLAAGGWGCISATTNVSAPLVAERLGARDAGDQAGLDDQIERVRTIIANADTVSGTKSVLARLRRDPEWSRTIPPNMSLDSATTDAIMGQLAACRDLYRDFSRI